MTKKALRATSWFWFWTISFLLMTGLPTLATPPSTDSVITVFYKTMPPSLATLDRVKDYLDSIEHGYDLRYLDMSLPETEELMVEMGFPTEHFPFGLAINGKTSARIDGKTIVFAEFPDFMHHIGRHRGNWTLAHLASVLADPTLLENENPRMRRTPSSSSRAAAVPLSFTGLWNSTFGPLVLHQQPTGATTGLWLWNGTLCFLQGTAQGHTLTFNYREPSTTGSGVFTLSSGNDSFEGRWSAEDGDSGQWSGTLVPATPTPTDPQSDDPPVDLFDGSYLSTFQTLRLARRGSRVRGLYTGSGGGTLEGDIDTSAAFPRLNFRWSDEEGDGEGFFEAVGGGAGLVGGWRTLPTEEWYPWHAIRSKPDPKTKWLVILEAAWDDSLHGPDYTFGTMMRSFMAPNPHVRVRHRFFGSATDLHRWSREIATLTEPVVLIVAAHGTGDGLESGSDTIPIEILAEALSASSNIRLIHFSSCLMMTAGQPERLGQALHPFVTAPISGYTTEVDWAGSAIVEFLLVDLILNRDLSPLDAVRTIHDIMPITRSPDEQLHEQPTVSPIPPLGLTIFALP